MSPDCNAWIGYGILLENSHSYILQGVEDKILSREDTLRSAYSLNYPHDMSIRSDEFEEWKEQNFYGTEHEKRVQNFEEMKEDLLGGIEVKRSGVRDYSNEAVLAKESVASCHWNRMFENKQQIIALLGLRDDADERVKKVFEYVDEDYHLENEEPKWIMGSSYW